MAAIANNTRSKKKVVQIPEAGLKIEHENLYDILMNRLVHKKPELIEGGADGIYAFITELKELTQRFCDVSVSFSAFLKKNELLEDFRNARRQRLDVRVEVNQFIDDANITLS